MAVVQTNTTAAQRQQTSDLAVKGDDALAGRGRFVRIGRLERVLLRRLEAASGFLARTRVALDFVGNLLVFIETTQAGLFNGRDVHEHVRAAVVRLDEAEALLGVEPLDGSGGHGMSFHWTWKVEAARCVHCAGGQSMFMERRDDARGS